MKEETFNRWFNVFILAGMTIAMLLTTAIKIRNAGSGQALLVLAAFGSLMGVLSTVCSANGKIFTFLFGLLDVTIYGVMCFIGAKYGNAAMHLLYFLPMQFIGFFQWKKRGADSQSKPKARRFGSRQWLFFSMVFLVASIVLYFILCRFDRSSATSFIRIAVLMDAVATVCNIIGQLLLSTAYAEQWYFWILVNVSTIIMWLVTLNGAVDSAAASYALIYIIKYSFYLLNSLNGLRIWFAISK